MEVKSSDSSQPDLSWLPPRESYNVIQRPDGSWKSVVLRADGEMSIGQEIGAGEGAWIVPLLPNVSEEYHAAYLWGLQAAYGMVQHATLADPDPSRVPAHLALDRPVARLIEDFGGKEAVLQLASRMVSEARQMYERTKETAKPAQKPEDLAVEEIRKLYPEFRRPGSLKTG